MNTTEQKYNGYKNRSTWLAVVHLDNTDEKVYSEAQKLAQKYKDMVTYWEDLQKHDSQTYSYPFHQHKAVETGLTNLLRITKISDEQNYRKQDIDLSEVMTHFYE